jgi:hypothetical protein
VTKQQMLERMAKLEQAIERLAPAAPSEPEPKKHFVFVIPEDCRVRGFNDYFSPSWAESD